MSGLPIRKRRSRGMVLGWLILGAVGFLPARTLPPHVQTPAPATATVPMAPDARAAITLTPIAGITENSGFMPVRVRIENRTSEARAWRIDFTFMTYSPVQAECTSSFMVESGGAGTGETVLFVPLAFDSANRGAYGYLQFTATVTGPEAAGFPVSIFGGGAVGNRHIAAARSLEPRIQEMLREQEQANPRRPGARAVRVPASDRFLEPTVVDIAGWPADWRVWSTFCAVMLEESDWEQLDSARRAALRDWVATGGQLLLFPREARPAVAEPLGNGAIRRLVRPFAALPRADLIRLMDEADAARAQGRRWPETPHLDNPADPLVRPFRAGGWLIGFVICFAVVAGPVNLFWFAPVGRRHRLFLTVPLLAVGGTCALWMAILIGDGLGGTGARQVLVMLLPGENRAVVHQQQLVRTGVISSGAFPLRSDTALVTSLGSDARTRRTTLARDGQTAAGDWFTNRSILRHELLRIEPTRARVELVAGGKGAPPVVQSSLGTTLRDFEYVDDAGTRWFAAEVPPGRRITLASPSREPTFSYAEPARRGQFRATGGASELAPIPTHRSIRWEDRVIIYTGRVEAAQP